MVGGFAFGNKTLVAVNERDRGFFDLPLANVAKSLATDWGLLGRLRRRPTFRPILGKLFQKGSLNLSGLKEPFSVVVCQVVLEKHTLKVGFTSSFATTKEADAASASTESAAPRIGIRRKQRKL